MRANITERRGRVGAAAPPHPCSSGTCLGGPQGPGAALRAGPPPPPPAVPAGTWGLPQRVSATHNRRKELYSEQHVCCWRVPETASGQGSGRGMMGPRPYLLPMTRPMSHPSDPCSSPSQAPAGHGVSDSPSPTFHFSRTKLSSFKAASLGPNRQCVGQDDRVFY